MRWFALAAVLLMGACGSPSATTSATRSPAHPAYNPASAPRGEVSAPPSTEPASAPRTEPSPTPPIVPTVRCLAGVIPAAMVIVSGSAGTFLYDVGDPLHPRAVCFISNASVHIVTGTSFEYLVPQPDGTTTSIVQHSLGTNDETVVGSFAVGQPGVNGFTSPAFWSPSLKYIAYTGDGGTDANGMGITDFLIADSQSHRKVYSFSIPGVDAFGRPGFPPFTIAISPDGDYIVAGWAIANLSVVVIRISDGVNVSPPMPAGVRFGFWGPTGHTLYLVGSAGNEIWTPEGGVANVARSGPWTLQPNFSPNGLQLVFTGLTASHDVRAYIYDFKDLASRMLIDQSRSGAIFVKSGWVWDLEEVPCTQSDSNPCFDPTLPDGKVLAMNLDTGQESAVTFAPGESPERSDYASLAPGDKWPQT